jgi:superoxide dismutase, Fe-Mn family
MSPGGAKEPAGDLKSAIGSAFGSPAKLAEKVNAAALGRFGSGWAWLIVDKNGQLDIVSTPNQDMPLEQGAQRVVLGVDVWEHAYYLKYRNKRADYLAAWWNTVNWDRAAANFAKAPV